MTSFVVGINHKTAPIDIREKFFLTSTEQDLLLAKLKNNPAVAGRRHQKAKLFK